MSPRLAPIEAPSGLFMRLLYRFSTMKLGKVVMPLKVIYSRLPLSFGMWTNKMLSLEKKLPLSEELRLMIRIYIAQINTCHFCIDIAQAEAMKRFKNKEKFFHLHERDTSNLYTESEKVALRFAKEVNNRAVTDETFAAIKKSFSEEQIVAIGWIVTSENVYNIMNTAFNIESDGFCQLRPAADVKTVNVSVKSETVNL